MPVSDRLPCQSSSPDHNVERMERRLTGSDAVPSKIKQPQPPPRLCAWFWCQWYLSGQATLTQKHRPSHGSACTCANQPKKPKNTRERLGQVSAQTAHMQNRRKNKKTPKKPKIWAKSSRAHLPALGFGWNLWFFCFFWFFQLFCTLPILSLCCWPVPAPTCVKVSKHKAMCPRERQHSLFFASDVIDYNWQAPKQGTHMNERPLKCSGSNARETGEEFEKSDFTTCWNPKPRHLCEAY